MRHGLLDSTTLPATPVVDDELLTAKEAANFVKLSIAAFWRNVCNRRLPEPVYPAPRAPRWWRSQLRLALERTRALPSDAKVARRQKRIAEERAKANAAAT